MAEILNQSNFEQELRDFEHVVPRLRKAILNLGGVIKEEVFPTIDEMRETIQHPKHRLFEKYFGTSDIVQIYNAVINENLAVDFPDHAQEFLRNWRASRSRQQSTNKMQETRKWGKEVDPVSKLLIVAEIASKVDNGSFSYYNEDKIWLEHNRDYYDKIGFSSQYHPSLLIRSEKAYAETESINIDDNEILKIAHAVVEMQNMIKGLHIEPMRLEDVAEEALDKNNKAAESAPGFRNQKHDKVRADVLEDAYFIKENCDYTDLQLINEQKRIQSGGNILFKNYYPIKFNTDGTLIFELSAAVSAVQQCASERGYFDYYSEEQLDSLPELSHIIQSTQLPNSESARYDLVVLGAPDSIMLKDKHSGDWLLNFITKIPNVFTLVKDIFPDEEELQNEIYTKHRSIKAAMAAHSRVGQSYLYPFMKESKKMRLKYGDPYYSMVAQWSHPDDIKTFITDMLVASVPQLFEGLNIDTTYSTDALNKHKEYLSTHSYKQLVSSDDKKGFDTRTKWYTTWLFYSAYFSLPFDVTDENTRLIKMFAMNDLFSLVSGVQDLILYSGIIGSGQFTTSVGGTYRSNIQSLSNRLLFMDPDVKKYSIESSDNLDLDFVPDDSGPISEW